MKHAKQFLTFNRCNNGIAGLEFAILLPILLTMIIATVEIARYAVIHQKLRNSSHAIADYVTRNQSVSLASLDSFADAVDYIMEPFGFANGNGTVIFTSVASIGGGGGGGGGNGGGGGGGGGFSGSINLGGGSAGVSAGKAGGSYNGFGQAAKKYACIGGCVIWQHRSMGNQSSKLGAVGTVAQMPQGYTLKSTQNVIVSEIFFNYRPILSFTPNIIPALAPQVNYSYAILKPRQGDLTDTPQ